MAFARWDPLQDLIALHERMSRMGSSNEAAGWVPPVDIYETRDRYVITAELPGLGRDDFQVQLQDGKLTLRGRRPKERVCCEQYHQVERGHGHFGRTFAIPQSCDPDRVAAELEDGLVTITIPKFPPRRIEIE
ncbi:MAG: Hsp20/alpha crystallin family protein [Vicinamibacterales bacterium]